MINNKFYIATYSAHASLLQEVVKDKKSAVKKLCVSYGGLKAPCGSYDDGQKDRLFGKICISEKILHAKVILKESLQKNELWLWTGNLRRNTLDAQNILISLNINNNQANRIKNEWFGGDHGPKKHLLLTKKSNSLKIELSESSILEFLKQSILSLNDSDRNEVFVFSPWGSSQVLENVLKSVSPQKANIYTRHQDVKKNLWIDVFQKNPTQRFIAKEDSPFPHSKCMFIKNENGKIVWAYIGSANFTEQAMKKSIKENANIEYALIIEGEECKPIEPLLKDLTCSHNWIEKKSKISKNKKNTINESIKEFQSEIDGNNSFEDREIQKECSFLIDQQQERMFDECYEKHDKDRHPFKKSTEYFYKVMNVGTFYSLLVRKKNGKWIEMYYERSLKTPLPFSISDAKASVSNIFTILETSSTKNANNNKKKTKDDDINKKIEFLNLRFPYEKIRGMKNKCKLDRIKIELRKLSKNKQILSDEYKKLVDIWLPLVNQMEKSL